MRPCMLSCFPLHFHIYLKIFRLWVIFNKKHLSSSTSVILCISWKSLLCYHKDICYSFITDAQYFNSYDFPFRYFPVFYNYRECCSESPSAQVFLCCWKYSFSANSQRKNQISLGKCLTLGLKHGRYKKLKNKNNIGHFLKALTSLLLMYSWSQINHRDTSRARETGNVVFIYTVMFPAGTGASIIGEKG